MGFLVTNSLLKKYMKRQICRCMVFFNKFIIEKYIYQHILYRYYIMSGGILQLVTRGVETMYLVDNPQITMFKCVYRRHTNFSISEYKTKIKTIKKFGDMGRHEIESHGDMLHKMYVLFEIPEILLAFDSPTLGLIYDILFKNGINWNYEDDGFSSKTILTKQIYNTNIKPLIFDKIDELVALYNLNIENYKDINDGVSLFYENQGVMKTTIQNNLTFISNTSVIVRAKLTLLRNYYILSYITPDTEIIDLIDSFIVTCEEIDPMITDIFEVFSYDMTQEMNVQVETAKSFMISIRTGVETMMALYPSFDNLITVLNRPTTIATIELLIESYDTLLEFVVIVKNNLLSLRNNLNINENYFDMTFTLLLQNVNPPNYSNLIKLHDFLKTYRYNLAKYSIYLDFKLYNMYDIKLIMYSTYLDSILKGIPSGEYTYTTGLITDIYDPSATTGANFTHIYEELKLYHVLDFGVYTVTDDIIGDSTIGYFDKILSQNYSTINLYSDLSSYKKYTQNLGAVSDSYKFLSSTSNLILVKDNLLNNINWNFKRNYQQIINIMTFLQNATFGNSLHYRWGYHKKFNYVLSTYSNTSNIYNSFVESSVTELNDNTFSIIPLVSLPGETTGIIQFFTNDVKVAMRRAVSKNQETLSSTVYTEYTNNFNLWIQATIDSSKMKAILDNSVTPLYNQATNFYTLFSSFSTGGKQRFVIKNYIPLLTIRDIPTMLYDLLDTTVQPLSNGGVTTPAALTILMRDYFDYRDVDQRGISPGGVSADTFKKSLYSDILEQVMVYDTGSSYDLMDEDYLLKVADANVATSTQYMLFSLFRPEETSTVLTMQNLLPIKAIAERMRIQLKSQISSFVSTYGLNAASVILINTIIDNIVNSFIKTDIPSYSNFVNNGYTFYNIDNLTTISSNTIIKYSDAISSIWYAMNLGMIRNYNDMFNNCLFSNVYYNSDMGLSFVELFDKFKNDGYFTYYDTDNTYPLTIYNANTKPVTSDDNGGYDFYLARIGISDPFSDFKTSVSHIATHYDKIYARYNSLSPILNIKTANLNRRLFLYEKASIIASNITTIVTPYVVLTTDQVEAQNIINQTLTMIETTYKCPMDIFSSSYVPLNMKSVQDLISMSTSVSNPYTYPIVINPNLTLETFSMMSNWWTVNSPVSSTVVTLFNTIMSSVNASSLFTDKNMTTIYNNYGNVSDVVEYMINKLFLSTDLKFIVDYVSTSLFTTMTTNLINYVKGLVTTNITSLSNLAIINTDFDIENGITRYITYVFNRTLYDGSLTPLPVIGNNVIYTNSPIDILLIKYITNSSPSYSFAKELGHRLIEKVTLRIDDIVYDEYTSELMSLHRKLMGDVNHQRGYDIMIGNTPEIYEFTNENRGKLKLYVPLYFWFCKDIMNSLPMSNILYSKMIVEIKTRTIDEILLKDEGSYFVRQPKLKAEILSEYVYTEEEERINRSKQKLEFLVERYKYCGKQTFQSKDFKNNTITSLLELSDPCKFLVWTHKVIIPKYESDKIDWLYNGYRTRDEDGNLTVKNVSIDQTKIQFYGRDRESYKKFEHYNWLYPESRNMGSLDFGEGFYPFCLHPKNIQPSGSVNTTFVTKMNIVDLYDENFVKEMTDNNYTLEYEYWGRTYQIIRVMSGFITNAFLC